MTFDVCVNFYIYIPYTNRIYILNNIFMMLTLFNCCCFFISYLNDKEQITKDTNFEDIGFTWTHICIFCYNYTPAQSPSNFYIHLWYSSLIKKTHLLFQLRSVWAQRMLIPPTKVHTNTRQRSWSTCLRFTVYSPLDYNLLVFP